MMKKPVTTKAPAEQVVKDIRRATRKLHSSEEKIRIVLSGLRGEDSIAELCRKEGIAQSLYYSWSKEFLEAGKKRLAGDTSRQANTGEVKGLRAEALALKELVADLSLENRLLKKNMTGADRGDCQQDRAHRLGAACEGRELQGRTGHLNEGGHGGAPKAPRRNARADVSDDDRTGPLPGYPEVLEGRYSSIV